MFFVICYDIADDKRRRKLDKLLTGAGRRVQESVFEANLNEKRYLALAARIGEVIDEEEDNVRFYRQCARCKSAIAVMGLGTVPVDGPDLLVV